MIDLPSFFQNSIKELQNQRQAEVESLAQRISLKVGQTTSALIERITPVNQQLADRMSQLQNTNLTAKANPLPAQLLSQPNLKLIELAVQGQTLLTLTDQPVKSGQTVQLLLKTAAQLVLVPDNKTGTLNTQTNQNTTSLTHAQQTTLSQSYREALPRQAPLQQTFRLLEALQRLPNFQQQLPAQLKHSLEQVRQYALSPQQLSTPSGLKQALQHSGVQLEARLNHQPPKAVPTAQQAPTQAAVKTSESALLTPNTKTQAASPTAPPLNSQDAKAALLHAEQRVSQYLAQVSATSGSTQRTPLQVPAHSPVETLVVLLKQFLAAPATNTAAQQESGQREDLLQTLQQQLQSAVAKMQTQQLHTLSQQFAKPDQPQAQHWLIELPVRLNNDVSSVEVRIDEDWVRPQDEEESKDKVRLWTVMLAFDLPERGKLFAQLKIVQDSVSANIWAEQNTTLAEAKRKLQTLRQRLDADGVNVTSIECFKGKPPMQDIRLDYALVDIKT
ncbi:hypothetical protein R50073_21650 [Maricurvus nonylphenolicus]|uniref:flagellar hook-length control protein FliK n=1 Tax=Maricurvus nonylphenolicus TaxID=1008307 RepID=UPI0036F40272